MKRTLPWAIGSALLALAAWFAGRASVEPQQLPSEASASSMAAPPAPTGSLAEPPSPDVASPWASASATALDRVASGDVAAQKALELVPANRRTIADTIALLRGREALARQDAQRLVADLAREPLLRRDPATMGYAAKLALDPVVAPELLAGLVAIDDAVLTDFAHDLGQRGEQGARLPLYVHDLLRSQTVRARVSRPLSIVLDLEDATQCWHFGEILPRAVKDADGRAASALERLALESGCGPKKTDDCAPCLRTAPHVEQLEQAIATAKSNPYKPPWEPARR